MRRWNALILPTVLGVGWLLALFFPLLSPERALGNRDIHLFHLPLRSSFRALAASGLPTWNPWVHGGQPILSNPSYGAFYPPSWLVFLVPPPYALTLMVLLHGAVAFCGAWWLARHFGCSRGVAALAGTAYVGCGAYLSLLSAFTLFTSMAWFPWVLAWGDTALRRSPEERWWRPALLAAGALALQLLNGEPATVLISGLALLTLAASARRRTAVLRLLVPMVCALLIAAVQLLPTLGRISSSARNALDAEYANDWSFPVARLGELFLPRLFGDPGRAHEGIFFGWRINDRGHPYIESIYPGLALTILGAAALIRWPIPRRATWSLCIGVGFLLALGRHDPFHELLRRVVPGLAMIRYPEKFIILAVFALAVAGVLGWQRLLDERQAGRREAADLPLALAAVVLAVALTLALLIQRAPPAVVAWMVEHGAPGLEPGAQLAALAYLRAESWAAVATAAAVVGLLALCRWRRPSRRWLEISALLVVAADLWHYGRALPTWIPAPLYTQPPTLARRLLPPKDRLYVQLQEAGVAGPVVEFVSGGEDPRTLLPRTDLARLEPYAGLLWGLPYALEVDYDLLLTGWARQADEIAAQDWRTPARAFRFLGVWNVRTLLLRRNDPSQPPAGPDPLLATVQWVENSHVLPRFRFMPRVTFHASHEAALTAARALEWQVARHEQTVRPGRPPEVLTYRQPPRQVEVADAGGRIEVSYQAASGAFLVVASTFDEGWRARIDDRDVEVYPTAAGQIGVALPPGEHRLTLEFREPLVAAGAVMTLTTLALGVAVLLWPGRPCRVA